MKSLLGVLTLAVVAAVPTVRAQPAGARPPGAAYLGRAFDFKPIAEGVYLAVGTGALSSESNAVVVVNASDVLVVDALTSPAAAWAFQRELRTITSKPIRYLVLTHFHYDHSYGAQAFPPGVELITSEFTRAMMADGKNLSHPTAAGNRTFANAQVGNMTRALDTASTPAVRRPLAKNRSLWQEYLKSIATVKPVVPNLTVTERMTLNRGGRDIVIFHPGPAHTAGDLVVWLPKERILATGDLLQPGLPYMADGFFPGWPNVLDSLQAMNPAVVLPGHGEAFTDQAVIARLSGYLRDIYGQAVALRNEGLGIDDVAKRLELSKYDGYYPRFPGWTDEMVARRRAGTVRRIFELLGGPK